MNAIPYDLYNILHGFSEGVGMGLGLAVVLYLTGYFDKDDD